MKRIKLPLFHGAKVKGLFFFLFFASLGCGAAGPLFLPFGSLVVVVLSQEPFRHLLGPLSLKEKMDLIGPEHRMGGFPFLRGQEWLMAVWVLNGSFFFVCRQIDTMLVFFFLLVDPVPADRKCLSNLFFLVGRFRSVFLIVFF